jgi:Zn finger protein HypA/HybF involved in hydrogenase expression
MRGTENQKLSVDNNNFTFFCPECHSRKAMHKSDIGKRIECEECCEFVNIDYPKFRPCPKCKKNIKLKARVCKHCKQRVMPFIDPFTTEPISTLVTPPVKKFKPTRQLQAIGVGLGGIACGFALGLFGTRAVAKLLRRRVTGNADYIIAAILAVYLAIHFYRAKKKL